MNNATLFHRPQWVITRNIGGKTILYHADSGEVFYLEGTAVAIWNWLVQREEFSFAALAQAMSEAFSGDPELIRAEIKVFLNDMIEQSLLHQGGAEQCR